jgi:NAD(P)H-dependent FMN reductase
MPHLHVILGSTRQGRFGDRVSEWFMSIAADRPDATVELVDLRDWPLPFFDQPVPPMMGDYGDPLQQEWAAKVAEADGFVLVTPEYNHGYPAVLKNALDHLYAEWVGKSVGFVGYGGPGGGIRAVEQLRQVVIELGMIPTRAQVAIPGVYRAFQDGAPNDPVLERTASGVLDEVLARAR